MTQINTYSPFTESQSSYLQRSLNSWLNVAEGGKRGGKNVLNTLCWCIVLDNHPDKLHLAAGVSLASSKLNIIECDGYGLLNYFQGRCRQGEYNNRDCVYINSRVGKKVILLSGGGKAGDQRYIKGNTYGTVYLTEVNECHHDFVQETFDRTISSNDRKIYHDLNPKAPNNWYYKEILAFHEKQQKLNADYGYNYGHFTLLDNLSINDDKLKSILVTYDKSTIYYQREILGLRKQSQGLVYPMFAANPLKFYKDKTPYFMEIAVGFDPGGEKSAHSFTATGITNNYKELYALRSERHDARDTTPIHIDKMAVEFVKKIYEDYGRCDYLYYDNEASVIGRGIKQAVEKVYPKTTVKYCYKGEVKNRIDLLVRLMSENRYYYTKDCQPLVEALETAMYDPKHDDVRLDDGSTPIDDLDSHEYSFFTKPEIARRFIQ